MSDERLRRLEREVLEGDPSARARLLAERVRAGSVSHETVRLAAYALDPAARAFLGREAALASEEPKAFARGLEPFGKRAGVCAAVAAASVFLPLWTELGEQASVNQLEAARAWLACPCEAHRRHATEMMRWAKAQSLGHFFIMGQPAVDVVRAATRADRSDFERPRAARLAAEDAAAAAEKVHLWCKPELVAFWLSTEHQRPERAREALRVSGIERMDEAAVRETMARALRDLAFAAAGV
ncbi:MAG TPA: hypothetical protein VFF73_04000 [Planctomycetota bacterium]|nr:hypothetical protein [Planctomycetota bacterium]